MGGLQHVARQAPSAQAQWLWDTCSGAPCMWGLPGSGTHLCLLPWQVDSMLLSTREARIPLVLTEASFEWDAWSHTDCPPSPGTLLRPGASLERQLPIHLLKQAPDLSSRTPHIISGRSYFYMIAVIHTVQRLLKYQPAQCRVSATSRLPTATLRSSLLASLEVSSLS